MLARLFSSLASFSPSTIGNQDNHESNVDVRDIHSRALLYPHSACSAENIRNRIVIAREKRSQKGVIFDSGEKIEVPCNELLTELLFGTVPLSHKGPSTKVHLLSAASGRLLVSRLFPLAIHERSGSTTPATVPSAPSSLGSTDEKNVLHAHPKLPGRSNTAPLSMTENVVQAPQIIAIGLILDTPINYDISQHWRLIMHALEQLSQSITDELLINGISGSSTHMSDAVRIAQKRLRATGIPNVACGMRWNLWVQEASWFTNASEPALRRFFDISLTAFLSFLPISSSQYAHTIIIGRDDSTLNRLIFLLASFMRSSDDVDSHPISPVSTVQRKTSHPVLRSGSDRILGWDIPQQSASSHFTESHTSTSGTLVSSISSHSRIPAPRSSSPNKHILKTNGSWDGSHLSNSDSTVYSEIPNLERVSSLDPSRSLSIQWKDRVIDIDIETPSKKERRSGDGKVAGFIDEYSPDFVLQGNPQFSTHAVYESLVEAGRETREAKILIADVATLRVTSVSLSKGDFQSQPLTKIDSSLIEAIREATSEGENNLFKAWLAIRSPEICLEFLWRGAILRGTIINKCERPLTNRIPILILDNLDRIENLNSLIQ